jgi:hypothetical protein
LRRGASIQQAMNLADGVIDLDVEYTLAKLDR